MTTRWPITLSEGPVTLRPIRRRDATAWFEVRRRNVSWLRPWEATSPTPHEAPPSFRTMVGALLADAREGRCLPFVVMYDGRLVGQLTVGGIVYGSQAGAHVGYWVDQAYAGRAIIPTAVALAADHCFGVLRLHRLEIAMRPENERSRRVAEKLGFRYEGVRERFLHIDGDWRDHYVYAMCAEDVPAGGLLQRVRSGSTHGPAAGS
jgi:ribosomal-protein-alanine N-acetyltransferase